MAETRGVAQHHQVPLSCLSRARAHHAGCGCQRRHRGDAYDPGAAELDPTPAGSQRA